MDNKITDFKKEISNEFGQIEKSKYKDDMCYKQRKTKLFNHQKFILAYYKKYNPIGILLYHDMGSGKTLSSILCVNYILPKLNNVYFYSSRVLFNNYKIEIRKHKFNKILNKLKYLDIDFDHDHNKFTKKDIIVMDEVHEFCSNLIRSKNKKYRKLYNAIMTTHVKVIFMSATPINKLFFAISPMFNMLARKFLFSKDGYDFTLRWFFKADQTLHHLNRLMSMLTKYVSYYTMKLPKSILAENMGVIPHRSKNKIRDMFDIVTKSNTNNFIYSENKITIKSIKKFFKNNKTEILHLTNKNLDLVQKKQYKYIIGDRSLKYGITIPMITNIHIMEPQEFYNDFKQITGRILRMCSHMDIIEKDRKVYNHIWVSSKKEAIKLYNSVKYKTIVDQLDKIMKYSAFDRLVWNFYPKKITLKNYTDYIMPILLI